MAALEEPTPEFEYSITNNARNQRILSVKIMLDGNEVGHFDFSGTAPLPNETIIGTRIEPVLSQTTPISLGIGIDDEYQDRRWSTPMISKMIESIGNKMSDDQELVIDTDASGGYWKHLGFEPNRHFGDTNRRPLGQGYEAFITFRKLKAHIIPRTKGGKQSRKKTQKGKRKTKSTYSKNKGRKTVS